MDRAFYSRWWREAVYLAEDVPPYFDPALKALEGRVRVLELGSGDGRFLRTVTSKGALAVGLDIVDVSVMNELPQVIADAVKPPFRAGAFDAVVALDVLEHVFDTPALLASIASVLSEGGILVASTPNVRQLPRVLSLVFHGSFPHTSEDPSVYDSGHIRFFTSADLIRHLSDSGFVGRVSYVVHTARFRRLKRMLEQLLPHRLYGEFFATGLLVVAQRSTSG